MKTTGNETTTDANAGFQPGTLKSLQTFSCFSRRFFQPVGLISHLECDENERKKVSSHTRASVLWPPDRVQENQLQKSALQARPASAANETTGAVASLHTSPVCARNLDCITISMECNRGFFHKCAVRAVVVVNFPGRLLKLSPLDIVSFCVWRGKCSPTPYETKQLPDTRAKT